MKPLNKRKKANQNPKNFITKSEDPVSAELTHLTIPLLIVNIDFL